MDHVDRVGLRWAGAGSLSCGSLRGVGKLTRSKMGGDVDAKNGDVEIAWDSSEVGADTEIEYVPLMRVEHPSLPSPQPNTAPLNQRTIEGIPIPREPWVWNDPKFNDFC